MRRTVIASCVLAILSGCGSRAQQLSASALRAKMMNALSNQPPGTGILFVNIYGVGLGTVTTSPDPTTLLSNNPWQCDSAEDSCGAFTPPGTALTFTPNPNPGSVFASWGGSCSGSGACQLTTAQASIETVTAVFQVNVLTTIIAGTGGGSVSSNYGSPSCTGGQCVLSLTGAPTSITLTAVAASGSTFAGWWGAGCSGTGTCTVSSFPPATVTALFLGSGATAVVVWAPGAGNGTITAQGQGVKSPTSCSVTASANLGVGNSLCIFNVVPASLPVAVTLTATSASGSFFEDWGGQCSGAGSCTVTVASQGPENVTAVFVSACGSGQTVCGSTCTNLQFDATNCGKCGSACQAGQTCVAGVCSSNVTTCDSGQTLCGSVCTSLQIDASNCGTCGYACPNGYPCANGACSTTCGSGQTLCGSACTSLQTDANNCGSCGKACSSGQTCVAGVCGTGTPTTCSSSGQTLCGRICTVLTTDANNYGSCGNACGTAQVCNAGTCTSGAPAINFFSGSGGSSGTTNCILAGGSITLSWNVTGATSGSIDHGVGSLTGKTSVTVSPTSTTTYALTATGPGGTTTAPLAVAVQPASGSCQPWYINVAQPGAGGSVAGGTVTSADGLINCGLGGTACGDSEGWTQYPVTQTSVALTATPASGWTFIQWAGACSGTNPTCTIAKSACVSTLTNDLTPNVATAPACWVGAIFRSSTPPPTLHQVGYSYAVQVYLSVNSTTPGNGTAYSNDGWLICTAGTCTELFLWAKVATFQALPNPGYQFESWANDCGLGLCQLSTKSSGADKSINAYFVQPCGGSASCSNVGHLDAFPQSYHGPAYLEFLGGRPGALACSNAGCHGSNLSGQGIALGCSNTYTGCHVNTGSGSGWGSALNPTVWQTDCSFCHGARNAQTMAGYTFSAHAAWAAPPDSITQRLTGTAAPSRTGAHQAHLNGVTAGGLSFALPVSCATCHSTPTGLGTPGSSHVTGYNQRATLSLSGAGQASLPASLGTYNSATGTCTTYCHGSGLSSATLSPSPTWSSTGLVCGSCHSLPPAPSTGHPAVGASLAGCHGCHSSTVNADGSLNIAGGYHIDGIIEYSGHPAGWVDPTLTVQCPNEAQVGGTHACFGDMSDYMPGQCTNCHGNGTDFTQNGGSSTASCAMCHLNAFASTTCGDFNVPSPCSCDLCHGQIDVVVP